MRRVLPWPFIKIKGELEHNKIPNVNKPHQTSLYQKCSKKRSLHWSVELIPHHLPIAIPTSITSMSMPISFIFNFWDGLWFFISQFYSRQLTLLNRSINFLRYVLKRTMALFITSLHLLPLPLCWIWAINTIFCQTKINILTKFYWRHQKTMWPKSTI